MDEKNTPRPYKDGELAKVKFVTDGIVGKLIVNGVDLSMCCEEVTIHQGGGECATVDLRLIPDDVEIEGEFTVVGSAQIYERGTLPPEFDTRADHDTGTSHHVSE